MQPSRNLNNEKNDEFSNLIDSDNITKSQRMQTKSQNTLQLHNPPIIYDKNPSFRYLDTIIENLRFSKYHLATLFVCIFSMMCGGFQTSHYLFSKNLLIRQYSWTKTQYSLIFILQNIFGALGAFISVTTTTASWDIHSNVLIGFASLIALCLLTYFKESPFFIILILVFNYCQGFINNICCNFQLEEFKFKHREFFFLFASSFRLLGNAVYGLAEYIAFDGYNKEDPIISILGLVIIQLCLTISLIFFYESPRLMYYNNQFETLCNYIEKVSKVDVKRYKKLLLNKIKRTKEEVCLLYPPQEYDNFVKHFIQIWKGSYLLYSLKSVLFVFLSSFLMSNIKDCYSYFVQDKSKYLFIIVEENSPHYKIVIYYILTFFAVIIFSIIKHLFNLTRKIIVIFCLVGCFVFLIMMIIFNQHFIYFLGSYEALAYFYHIMVYMYFSTYTTTQLRNSVTSLLYISLSLSYIFQSILLNLLNNYTLFGYLNFIVTILLGILELLIINKDTKDMQLQEIEVNLLNSNNGPFGEGIN